MDHVRVAYDIPNWKREWTLKFGSSEETEEMKKLYFFKKWPTVNVASEPDNIKWANLRYPLRARCCRQSIIWFIAVLLVFLSLIGIVIMKNETTVLRKKFKSDTVCPNNTTKEQAWMDHQLIAD